MASQGPNSPGTGADDAGIGTLTWTGPGNITASDNSYATVQGFYGNTPSHYLKATNFGFSVPTGATIDGIVDEWERKASANTPSFEYVVDVYTYAFKSGGAINAGTNKAATGVNWSTTEAYFSYGGASDLWGLTWATTDVNASGTGAALSVLPFWGGGGLPTASVDHVRRTVYYTVPPAFTASGSLTAAHATLAGSATFTQPAFTATGSLTTAHATLAGSASFTQPAFTATGSLTTAHATLAGSATFTQPAFTATGSLTAGPIALAGIARHSSVIIPTRCGAWGVVNRRYPLHNATRQYTIQQRGNYQWRNPAC